MKKNNDQVELVEAEYNFGDNEVLGNAALPMFQLGYYSRIVAVEIGDGQPLSKLKSAARKLADLLGTAGYIDVQRAIQQLEEIQPTSAEDDGDNMLQWLVGAMNDALAVISPGIHSSLTALIDGVVPRESGLLPWYKAGVVLGSYAVAVATDPALTDDGHELINCVRTIPQEVVSQMPPLRKIAEFNSDVAKGYFGAATPTAQAIVQSALAQGSRDGVDILSSANLSELVQQLELAIASLEQPTQPVDFGQSTANGRNRDAGGPASGLAHGTSFGGEQTEGREYITLEEARKRLPGHPSETTIWRYYRHGVNGVRLETIRVAGKRFTTVEAIHRFIAATTAAADGESAPVFSPMKRERAINVAERELGVCE